MPPDGSTVCPVAALESAAPSVLLLVCPVACRPSSLRPVSRSAPLCPPSVVCLWIQARPAAHAMEEDPKLPPKSNESRIKNTRTRKVTSKKTTKPSPSTGPGSSRASPAASPCVASQSVHNPLELEGVDEEDDDDDNNSFDHNDELSRAQRGRKRLKAGAGVPLSPTKCKVARGKRAGCWKCFKVINVPSGKESGAMETKAKCMFCTTSYTYHPRGSTTQLNCHLKKCTQYLNKLEKAKTQGAR